uniref:Transcription factor TFIIB cyclin-like domain-containing protein n=1 Tax=Aegilops tauschii subsp. strangulata TaxID=200361 RepID=A0A452ZVG9_AEGTS
MVYCSHCDDDCPYVKDPDNGFTCCGMCGKVIDQDMYTEEPTFFKDSSGQSRLRGHIIGIAKGGSLSRERTEEKGRDEIWQIVHGLHVSGGDDIICTAHNFYKLALDNFTRGRRTTHVAASCLYIACRGTYLFLKFNNCRNTLQGQDKSHLFWLNIFNLDRQYIEEWVPTLST